MTFEKILQKIGGAKRYQMEVLFAMMFVKMFPGMVTLIPVFSAAKRNYYCKSPYSSTNTSLQCEKEATNGTLTCSSWTFSKDPMDTTIQSLYTLICSRTLLASLTTTIYFLGFMIGCMIYGKISDRFGRRISLIIATFHLLVSSLSSAFPSWYWLYGSLRFLIGVGNGGMLTILFTLASEATDTEHRVFWSIMVSQGWSIGILIMGLTAYFVRDIFHLQLILYCPIILSFPVILIFVKESPRWLYVNRRTDELDSTIRYIAKRNGMPLESSFDIKDLYEDDIEKPRTRTMRELWQLQSLRNVTLIVWLGWFVVSLSFYAASLGVGTLGGNIFINAAIGAAIEIPSRFCTFYLTEKMGRVPTLFASFTVAGICVLTNGALFEKPELSVPLTVLAMVAKFCFTMAFDVIWLFSAEIFPTECRNLGIGFGSTWARIGAIASTLVGLLGDVWGPAPFILLGILPLLAAFGSIFLPETNKMELPETMEEGNTLARRGNKILSFFGWRGGSSVADLTDKSNHECDDFTRM